MFTKCSKCQAIQPVSVGQLRSEKGRMQCQSCLGTFNALDHLSESADMISVQDPLDSQQLWHLHKTGGHSGFWLGGSIAAFLLLLTQASYFEKTAIIQNQSSRIWLEKVCRAINCQLPAYQNLKEFSVLPGQLTPLADQQIHFQTALNNQAAFVQNYPNLKLTLMDFAGNAYAQRIFQPKEYLAANAAPTLLAEASAEVNLIIVGPTKQIGGYTFDLTY